MLPANMMMMFGEFMSLRYNVEAQNVPKNCYFMEQLLEAIRWWMKTIRNLNYVN